jgi:ribonuclease VapC
VVLDASALLALLQNEPGGDAVADSIPGAVVSTVNLSEVVAKLMERGIPEPAVRAALRELELEIYPFGEDLAYQTGILRPSTRSLGLSLGDRACLALGQHLALPVLTTERTWSKLHLEIEVRVIR